MRNLIKLINKKGDMADSVNTERKKESDEKVRFSAEITREQRNKLHMLAAKRHMSMSEYFRRAIIEGDRAPCQQTA